MRKMLELGAVGDGVMAPADAADVNVTKEEEEEDGTCSIQMKDDHRHGHFLRCNPGDSRAWGCRVRCSRDDAEKGRTRTGPGKDF